MINKYYKVFWTDIKYYCDILSEQIANDGNSPDIIIGLMRGGIIPARLFSDHFGVLMDFYAIDVKYYDGIGQTKEAPIVDLFNMDINSFNGKKILIVDDIWDSGVTMKCVQSHFQNVDAVVSSATMHAREGSDGPDYYGEIVPHGIWIVYPWEIQETKDKIIDMEEIKLL